MIIIFTGSDTHVCFSPGSLVLPGLKCLLSQEEGKYLRKMKRMMSASYFMINNIYTGCLKGSIYIYTGCLNGSVSNIMTVIYRVFLKNRLRIRPPGVYLFFYFICSRAMADWTLRAAAMTVRIIYIYTGCLKGSVSNVMTVIYRVFLKNRLRIRPPGFIY